MTPEPPGPVTPELCAELSALIFRSKAHWPYDPAWLEARRADLTVAPRDLSSPTAVIRDKGRIVAIAQVRHSDAGTELERMFIDPDHMGRGHGAALFHWAVRTARALGAKTLGIASDPHAEAFYRHMGARRIGSVPSPPPPGRRLPRLAVRL